MKFGADAIPQHTQQTTTIRDPYAYFLANNIGIYSTAEFAVIALSLLVVSNRTTAKDNVTNTI